MINIDYHSTLISFVAFDKLPLWVTSPALPQHPERKFHDHEYSEIVVILKGDAVHLTEKAAVPIKAGDVLVIYPGQIHAYDKTEGMKLVNIIYDHRRLPVPLLDAYSLPLFKYFFPDKKNYKDQMQLEAVTRLKEKDLKHVAELIEALEKEIKTLRPGNFFLSLTLFMEIIAFICRLNSEELPEHHAHFLIGNAISFMKNNFQNPISIGKLAAAARMSPRNFFRLFKNTVGCTPINYLLRIRLHYASEMLALSDARSMKSH